ncbi:MAG: hypothetical protein NVS3B7_09280 [Candidatus Elarobacter sp.]
MNAVVALGIVGGVATSAGLLWMSAASHVEAALQKLPALRASVAPAWRKFRAGKRKKKFMPQLESALRMTAGSLRVGLGLRQALVVVAEELGEPAKTEFARVVGRTNLGVSILDALDEFAERMPSSELSMTVRAIRVQSQTGGDLADLLETVADTIKARRTLDRKVQALTSEGKISAYVILALPICVGIFLALTQPRMGHALLFTTIGHGTLVTVFVLEAVASFVIAQMLKVEL